MQTAVYDYGFVNEYFEEQAIRIVTDRDKPVAKIYKYREAPPTKKLFADLKGGIKYLEDPTAPTTEEWRKF